MVNGIDPFEVYEETIRDLRKTRDTLRAMVHQLRKALVDSMGPTPELYDCDDEISVVLVANHVLAATEPDEDEED